MTLTIRTSLLFLLLACGSSSPSADEVTPYRFVRSFDNHPVGTYTRALFEQDWGAASWSNGIDEGRVEIVATEDGRSLRVHYPPGGHGSRPSGAQWRMTLDRSHNELYCAYRIRFGNEFTFVKGGKIPGLSGGESNTGGNPPDGTDGWSARMMWRRQGRAVQYVYHPDQPGRYAEDFRWNEGGSDRHFQPGQWHRVVHHIVMNAPGERDGSIRAWFDGELALDRRNIRFRDVSTFAIDHFLFSTFFGGSDSTWAPATDQVVDFDDFEISTSPILP